MKLYLLLFLLILSPSIQASRLIFNRLTAEDGLSSSQVTSILQDKKGYTWIGTTEGLNRYDGQAFMHISPQPRKTEVVQNSAVHSLYEDATGGI